MKRIVSLLAATSAFAQTAGTRAVVTADTAPVYAKMTTENPPTLTLKRGEPVVIGMVLFGDEITWCVITRPGETKRLGYLSCELVGAADKPAAPPPEAPAAVETPPPPKPVIREVPSTPAKVREVTPVDLSRINAPTPPPKKPEPAPVLATEILPSTVPPAATPKLVPGPPPRAERAAATEPVSAPSPKSDPGPAGATEPPAPKRPVPTAAEPVPTPPNADPAPAVATEPSPAPKRPVPAAAEPVPSPPKSAAPAVATEPSPNPKRAVPAANEPVPAPPNAGVAPAVATEPPPPPKREIPVAAEPPAPKRDLESPPRPLGPWALDDSALTHQFAAYVRATSLLAFLEKSRLQEIETGLLTKILSKHFTGPAFSRAVAARLTAGATTSDAAAVSRFLSTPAARAAGNHLRRATQTAAHAELVAYAAKLRDAPPDPARLLLIHRLWNATRSSDLEVDTTMTVVRATALALNPILPDGKQFTASSLDSALTQVRTAYLPVMKNARVVHYLFAFDGLPLADLESYTAFWESPPGQWLTAQVRQGFADAARTASRNLTSEIARRGP